MKRILLVLATIVAAVLMVGGVALAVTKIGTDGPDTLMGTKGSDVLSGRGGTDWIDGRAGNDVIRGGPGNDPLVSPAIGILDGGPGADVVSGGPGVDTLIDGPWPGDSAVDTLKGGDGDDFLDAENRTAALDIVDCGAGRHDIAVVDRMDMVADDCEKTW